MKDNTIVVRPGISYMFSAFVAILAGVFMLCRMGNAGLLEESDEKIIVVWLFALSYLLIGLLYILYILLTKIKVDDEKITIYNFKLQRKEYLWSEISNAKVFAERFSYSYVIYAGERRIVKIPQAYSGYEKLFYELDKRNIIRKDDWYRAAKAKLIAEKRISKY